MKLDIREWIALGLVAGVIAVKAWLFLGYDPGRRGSEEVRATLNLAEAMGGADTAGYAKALEPRPFEFPADHGPHPAFRTEWWYVTSNLESEDGRRFGVQFTLFRSALAPEAGPAGTPAPWATRQIHMGHLAVTDVAAGALIVRESGGLFQPLEVPGLPARSTADSVDIARQRISPGGFQATNGSLATSFRAILEDDLESES